MGLTLWNVRTMLDKENEARLSQNFGSSVTSSKSLVVRSV